MIALLPVGAFSASKLYVIVYTVVYRSGYTLVGLFLVSTVQLPTRLEQTYSGHYIFIIFKYSVFWRIEYELYYKDSSKLSYTCCRTPYTRYCINWVCPHTKDLEYMFLKGCVVVNVSLLCIAALFSKSKNCF